MPIPADRRPALTGSEAGRILYVQCLEEADPAGNHVTVDLRRAASRKVAAAPNDARYLVQRTDVLAQSLPAPLGEAMHRALQDEETPWRRWMPWAVIGGALIIGWLTNELGPDRRINILSFPLLGLILWNLAVCGLSLVHEFRSRKQVPAEPPPVRTGEFMEKVAADFRARRAVFERPRRVARVKIIFHTAAIALALGIVGGMYVRGLVRAYTVTWESTFLDQAQVRRVTQTVLGPASVVTGIRVPEPSGNTTAAPWIHLWAASAVLFIFVPRMLLINMARREARRAEPDYPGAFAPYLDHCRSMEAEGADVAAVIAVHHEPEPALRDSLRRVLQHVWGGHVVAHFHPVIAYGAEEEAAAGLKEVPSRVAVIFPLVSTPEADLHGELVRAFTGLGLPRERTLAVLDASAFAAKLQHLPEFPRRLAERRAAWEKVIGGAFPVLLLDEAARRDPAGAAMGVKTQVQAAV